MAATQAPTGLRRPLLIPAIALLAGTALLPENTPWWLLLPSAAIALTAAWLAFARGRTAVAAALAALALVPCGALNRNLHEDEYARHLLPPGLLETTSTEAVDIEGSVLRLPAARLDRDELDVAVTGLRASGADIRCGFHVRLSIPRSSIGETLAPLLPGDRVEVSAKIFAAGGFRNPGAFDPATDLRRDGIHHRGYVKSPALVHRLSEGGWTLARLAAALRRDFSRRIRDSAGDAGAGDLACALILGERERLPASVQESMRRSGLYHLLAISGGNFALFAWFVFSVLRLLRVPEKPTIFIVFVLMLLYAAMVEFEPSVMRAFVMISVYLAGLYLERGHQLLNALGVALIVSVATDPSVVGDYGFQLTFLATSCLVLFAPVLARAGSRARRPGWLRSMAAINLASGVGLAPYLAFHFNRVALGGIILNFVAIPLSGIVMGLGLLSYLGSFTALGPTIGRLLPLSTRAFLALSDSMPFPTILSYRCVSPPLGLIIAFYALLAAVVLAVSRRRVLRAAHATLLAALFYLSIAWPMRPLSGRLRVTCIDVGQGDSILVDFPSGAHMLVDGGGNYEDTFDYGANVVAPYLFRRGVDRLDFVVISHAHPDHVNGLRSIVANFAVGKILEGINPLDDPFYSAFRKSVPDSVPMQQVERGMSFEVGAVVVQVLHPATKERRGAVLNDDSVVLRLVYGQTAVMLPGDIQSHTEQELIDAHLDLHADLLKCPHHGSRTSALPAFISAVKPGIVLISAGRYNRWGLPHPEVIAAYRREGATVLSTHRCGAIAVELDGESWREVPP